MHESSKTEIEMPVSYCVAHAGSTPHEFPAGYKLPSMHNTAWAYRPAPYQGGSTGQLFAEGFEKNAGTNKVLHIPVGAHKIRGQISGVWILQNRWGNDKEPLHKSGLLNAGWWHAEMARAR